MRLFFAGDVVLADGCAKEDLLSKELKTKVGGVNIVCCNFEAPVADGLRKQKKVGPNNVNAVGTVSLLSGAGFNLATLANNHIFDFGCEGMHNTIQMLEDSGIHTVGAGLARDTIHAPYIADDGECKVGIINVAENGFGCAVDVDDEYGYAYIYDKGLEERISRLKAACEAVIVVCHAGAEGWDFPLPEWRQTYQSLIDMGADAVIAHHPHVPQGYEVYQGKPIFYSLGNFAFDKGNGPQCPESYCVVLDIGRGMRSFEVIPTIFRDGRVECNHSDSFAEHLKQCCLLLQDEEAYRSEVNRKCLEGYKYYQRCYGKVVCAYRGGFRERMKGVVKRYIMGISFQDIWLYHNIAIETHLYVCRRAARLRLKEENIL